MHSTQHHVTPGRSDRVFNSIVRWLADRGVNLAGAQTLTIVGRKSGAPQSIPVNPIAFDGREYLVAVRGNTQWVRNARAARTAHLRRGRNDRTVTLAEVDVADRGPIIRAYLKRWGWEVGRFLPDGMTTDPSDDQLHTHAASIPVFAVGRATTG